PGQHSCWVDSTRLLLEPTPRVLALNRLSCCPSSLLSPATGRPRIRRCIHLRRVMRGLLLRGIGLLPEYPRKRIFSEAAAITWISGAIHYGAELQGDGGYASRDCPDL